MSNQRHVDDAEQVMTKASNKLHLVATLLDHGAVRREPIELDEAAQWGLCWLLDEAMAALAAADEDINERRAEIRRLASCE